MRGTAIGSKLVIVRFRRLFALTSVALAVSFAVPHASAQDFDPHGRHKPPPGKPGGRPPVRPPPGGGHPVQPRPPDAGGSIDANIAKYTHIVLSQPGTPFPLQKLAQLYRDRDGNLQKLVSDFEA